MVATQLFHPLDIDSAPEASRRNLNAAKANYGFVPNMLGAMANAPGLLEAYTSLTRLFKKSSFSALEQQLVYLTASVENECDYCSQAHGFALVNSFGISTEDIERVRTGRTPKDVRLSALVNVTREIVRNRGTVSDEAARDFSEAGYQPEQLLELLIGVAAKTLTNSLDHLSPVELDEEFQEIQ